MIAQESRLLTIKSNQENIALIEPMIADIFDKYAFNQEFFGNILVATTEAVNNAIIHGNSCNEVKNVTISYKIDYPSLIITVEDEGIGFDATSLPDPTDPMNIEKPSGRGVFLMKQLTDEITFSNNGSIVSMIFHIISE
jgi:serine/threonine-protein kinase RsbW